jgi:cytochrome c-type biogenesis protein CcmI
MEYLLGAVVVLVVLGFVVLPLVRGRSAAADVREAPDPTHERAAIYRELLELELDQKVGKLADADYHELSEALLARAAALISQEDASSTAADALVEREIAGARATLRRAESASVEEARS